MWHDQALFQFYSVLGSEPGHHNLVHERHSMQSSHPTKPSLSNQSC
uniref:Uncharacterized protein n=1 Tax=Arundo donax TaxID=35708 RepID=A0A0A8Z0Z4_ARUDO